MTEEMVHVRSRTRVSSGLTERVLICRLENFFNLFRRCDVNVLAVEYRGYGLSEGTPGEEAIRADSQAVLDWLLGQPDIDPVQRGIEGWGGACGLMVLLLVDGWE
jgi:hypothetical protein